MSLFNPICEINKPVTLIWLLIFYGLFVSSAAYAVADMKCRISGHGNTFPYSSAAEAGAVMCNSEPGSFNTGSLHGTPINSESETSFYFNILCLIQPGYGGEPYISSNSSGMCVIDSEFYADGDSVELDAQDSADNSLQCSSGGPINLITGNKYKIHADIETASTASSLSGPQLTRIYNSTAVSNRDFVIGENWLHSYQRKLRLSDTYFSKLKVAANTNHSEIYVSKSSACVSGYNNLGENHSLAGGTPQWNDGRCEIIKDGQYIGTIAIRVNGGAGLIGANSGDLTKVTVLRPDGNEIKFRQPYYEWPGPAGTVWVPLTNDKKYQLSYSRDLVDNGSGTQYETTYFLKDENDNVEIYDSIGVLTSIEYMNGITDTLTYDVNNQLDRVENNIGKFIQFTYDANGKIASITDNANRTWQYQYDTGQLLTVINPDLTEKNYHYEDASSATALTGLTDERGIRYSTFLYNADGKAESSYLGAPTTPLTERIKNTIVDYSGTGFNTVTDSRGIENKYYYASSVIENIMNRIDGPECIEAYCEEGSIRNRYSGALNMTSSTKYGIRINYDAYDDKGNPGMITEAVGTSEEIVKTYDYDDSRYRNKVTKITEPSVFSESYKTTNITYDDFANITSVVTGGFDVTGGAVSHTQNFEYNGPLHQLTKIDGPRTDIDDWMLIEYYADDVLEGNNRTLMKAMTDALGNIVYDNIAYTVTGEMSSYESANNLQVSFTYYPGNDRLETITQTDTVTDISRTTYFTYLATGEVASVATGYGTVDETTVTFDYDNARRLTRIYDGLGNYIEYTLDTESNKTNESIYDSSGLLKKRLMKLLMIIIVAV